MRQAVAIAGREYASMFRIPLGWVVVALFLCLSSMFFVTWAIRPGEPASMRAFFGMWWGLVLFLAPAISMRMFSEEFRTGTIESLLTAPAPEAAVVAGKYAAAVMFLVTMMAPTLAFVVVLSVVSRPDLGSIASGYMGLVMLGMLYLAVGTLASSLTSSQTLAFLATLFALLLLDLLPGRMSANVPAPWDRWLYNLSPSVRVGDFSKGLVDSAHVVFFLAASLWFLTLAVVALQSRRWR